MRSIQAVEFLKSRSILTEPHLRKFGDSKTRIRQDKRPLSRAQNYSSESSHRGSSDEGTNRFNIDQRKSRDIKDMRDSFGSLDDESERYSRTPVKGCHSVTWGMDIEQRGRNSVKSKKYGGREIEYKDPGKLKTYETHQLIMKERESNKNLVSSESRSHQSGLLAKQKSDQCKSVPKSDKVSSTQKPREMIRDRPDDGSVNIGSASEERKHNQYDESRLKGKNDILHGNRVITPIRNQSNGKAFYQDDVRHVQGLHTYQNLKDNRSQKLGNGGKETGHKKMRIPEPHGTSRKGEGS